MARPALEVADILRDHGPAWRQANSGHLSLDQLKVMSAIERCRTAALGGYLARCENATCGHTEIAYNSCRNRHCPKCQAAASRRWLADREAELLPVPYFHVVYTLPSELRDIAYQNKRVVYDLLMKAAAETTLAIAADPKRLGATSAALPVPTLRRPHDLDRGLRARLRAEHGRHVMTQAYCERRDFPVPMRWLYPGNDLSRPDHADQCAQPPLVRSEGLPKCPSQAPHLACPHIPVASRHTIKIGADIKSP